MSLRHRTRYLSLPEDFPVGKRWGPIPLGSGHLQGIAIGKDGSDIYIALSTSAGDGKVIFSKIPYQTWCKETEFDGIRWENLSKPKHFYNLLHHPGGMDMAFTEEGLLLVSPWWLKAGVSLLMVSNLSKQEEPCKILVDGRKDKYYASSIINMNGNVFTATIIDPNGKKVLFHSIEKKGIYPGCSSVWDQELEFPAPNGISMQSSFGSGEDHYLLGLSTRLCKWYLRWLPDNMGFGKDIVNFYRLCQGSSQGTIGLCSKGKAVADQQIRLNDAAFRWGGTFFEGTVYALPRNTQKDRIVSVESVELY